MIDARQLNQRHPEEIQQPPVLRTVVGGQALDLEAENDTDVDLAAVEWIHVRKTGALILASIRVGARCPGGAH